MRRLMSVQRRRVLVPCSVIVIVMGVVTVAQVPVDPVVVLQDQVVLLTAELGACEVRVGTLRQQVAQANSLILGAAREEQQKAEATDEPAEEEVKQ